METFSRDGYTYQRWKVGASTFTACMELGARLMRWELDLPSGKREVIYWPENANMEDIGNVRGGNPILFPFMGRNYATGEKFAWKDPDGTRRPMPQHGWARQGKFEITRSSADSVEARFLPSAASQEGYPYNCEFYVRYKFGELSLDCELELVNNESKNIPWCAGHHFYFGLPWHKGLGRQDYILNIPAKKTWQHAADGKLVPLSGVEHPTNFGNPIICDCIHTKLTSNVVTFGPKSGEENVTIRVGEDPVPDSWAAVVTWTQADDSPFYCVEPWMGPPNSHEHKNGLHWVMPGQSEKFFVSIRLD
ncbi:MAG: hypothetical protein LBV12_04115 [Puniceicoccales bacterium]|jgi:galactose mutarotase-like enzyme|nr:hypothetical protein [Puniceicoccales bacterium]